MKESRHYQIAKHLLSGSGLKGGWDAVYVLLPLAWLPTIIGIYFANSWIEVLVFAILYSFAIFALYLMILLITYKKYINASLLHKCICALIILLTDGVMIYLYNFKIITSKVSLLTTIPIVVLIAFICVSTMVQSQTPKKEDSIN
ncbi:hypothetical protein FACS189430_02380 [Bacteroidia bacterium]|nr:hypothetical protein FACS189430_02380 [Bacteroidia bacterium]